MASLPQPEIEPRAFSTAKLTKRGSQHYVDDYRYTPGRTLCGRGLHDDTEITRAASNFNSAQVFDLCAVCASADYPTESEWREFHRCIDCGISTLEDDIDEAPTFLKLPTLREAGLLVDDSEFQRSTRCLDCFELKLKRTLCQGDFHNPYDFWHAVESEAIRDRLESLTSRSLYS